MPKFTPTLLSLLLISTSALLGNSAWAQADLASSPRVGTSRPGDDLTKQDDPMRGWIFFKDPLKEKKPDLLEPLPPRLETKPDEPKRCKDAKQWTAKCGFTDPGNDFEWQARQRDALLNTAVLAKNDSKSVEEFQKYNKWVLDKAMQFANLWQFNLVQNPELSASYTAPISEFGLALVTRLAKTESADIFELIKNEGGLLAYFTRDNCNWCHEMLPTAVSLSKDSGIPLYNASLEGKCLVGVGTPNCVTGNAVLEPASRLQITRVPAMVLYLPPNTWIRIANGLEDLQTMKANVVNFSSAYRSALLSGVPAQDGRVPVDFETREQTRKTGLAAGVKLPTEADVTATLKSSAP